MNILLIEPFFSGSHQQWAEDLLVNSTHDIRLLTLPGYHWKWRMYGGAVTLAKQALGLDFQPDLLLATDMLDLTTFLALTRQRFANIPNAIYFHENQLTYPWSPTDPDVALKRDGHYAFTNYTSALAADKIFFNSPYHLASFNEALPAFLRQFPDHKELNNATLIRQKSSVLPLGMDLRKFDKHKKIKENNVPVLLWNHRWEYDKNPDAFFKSLFQLKAEGIAFQVIILGEQYKKSPKIFAKAKDKLANEIIHFGYANSFEEYAKWLWRADILPVTSQQDFFGGSVVEAMYCDCLPILPNRLAYPMHVPAEKRTDFFYNDAIDFYKKLKTSCIDFAKRKEQMVFSDFVSHYDWFTLAPKYDAAFSKMNNIK